MIWAATLRPEQAPSESHLPDAVAEYDDPNPHLRNEARSTLRQTAVSSAHPPHPSKAALAAPLLGLQRELPQERFSRLSQKTPANAFDGRHTWVRCPAFPETEFDEPTALAQRDD